MLIAAVAGDVNDAFVGHLHDCRFGLDDAAEVEVLKGEGGCRAVGVTGGEGWLAGELLLGEGDGVAEKRELEGKRVGCSRNFLLGRRLWN